MPAPFWGRIDPAGALLEQRMMAAQQKTMEKQARTQAAALRERIIAREVQQQQFTTEQQRLETQAEMQLQQYQMQYGVGMAQVDVERGRLSLDERKQLWAEYQKELPTFIVVDGALLATYPDGTAIPAWQAPPEPVTLTTEQFLIDPVTGQPIWAPPKTTVTDREIVTTDRLTGELINRVALDQLPPKAVFKTTEVGEILVFDEQGTLLKTVTSPGTEALMQQIAAEAEQDRMLALRAQEVVEAEVEVTKGYLDIAWVESGREDVRLKIAQAESDLATDYFMLAQTTEERQGAQFYITHGLAVRAQISAEKALEINVMLTKEGYDLQRDMKKIEYRIAAMTDLTENQKVQIMAGLEDRRLRMESGRIEAEVEAGRFITRGDVTVRRNEDGTFSVAFEWPQERYGLTPMLVGDEKSGYSIAMIDPYKGTVNILGVLPGGAEGAEDAKRHLELLDMARKIVDPGNTFLTSIDPEVKEEIYRQTMALYSDLIQAPRPAGMGYTPEEAARFTTPMELWRAQGITLTFGGTPPEPTALLFEKFLQEQPFGRAVEAPLVVTPASVAVTPAAEVKKPKTSQDWIDEFKGVRSGEISALQRYMISEGLWEGEVDGKWSAELGRKFKIAFRRGEVNIRETGE